MNIESARSLVDSLAAITRRAPRLGLAECEALLKLEIDRMNNRGSEGADKAALMRLSARGLIRFHSHKPWPVVTQSGHFIVHGHSAGEPLKSSSKDRS